MIQLNYRLRAYKIQDNKYMIEEFINGFWNQICVGYAKSDSDIDALLDYYYARR